MFSVSSELSFCLWHQCPGCDRSGPASQGLHELFALSGLKMDPAAMTSLRLILAEAGHALNLPLMGNDEVVTEIQALISSGILRPCGIQGQHSRSPANPPAGLQPGRTELQVIQRLGSKREDFLFEGRVYRVMASLEWKPTQDALHYRVMKAADARALLQRMSAAATVSAAEKEALEQAAALLSDQATNLGTGLLLLCRLPQAIPLREGDAAPAFTPSQLAKIRTRELHWVEIMLVDQAGTGVANQRYQIVTPDKEVHTGTTDAQGWARIDGFPVPGPCRISFLDLDRNSWHPA